ncbi:hypothetical protein PBY51_009056 [Eleginops maclovinus]|uniref:Uncharacterized protein n=1 Tax=Eleginops maclovinus TaxID=56733 RepID=A0AAN7WVC0_ELEMC|nr:hypothetical protein PBY51_009056 [Eleginops maclovinus]
MKFLPLFLPLMSLLSLSAGVSSDSCSHLLHADITRETWRRTAEVVRMLPKEEKYSGRHRLLPRFCTNCSQRLIGWSEIRDLMDVYQRSVFSRPVVKKLLSLEYKALLHRIQHTLQLCVSSSAPSKWYEVVKKMEKKIRKRRDERALKAVTEFNFVLNWINELQHLNL